MYSYFKRADICRVWWMLMAICDFYTRNGEKKLKANKSLHSFASSPKTFIFHIVTECRIYLRECSQFYELSHSTSLWTFQYYRPRLRLLHVGWMRSLWITKILQFSRPRLHVLIDSTGIWFKVFRPPTLFFFRCTNHINDTTWWRGYKTYS